MIFIYYCSSSFLNRYYSYLWAQVLAQDAWGAFKESGDEKVLGSRFRETVLSLGGAVSPMEVFKEFRGKEPDSKYLLDLYLGDR